MRGFEIERTLDEDTCSMETLPEKILKVPGIALVAAGTPACLISLYDSAERINTLDRLFLCQISPVEYSLGKQGKKIWQAVEQAANTEGIRGVIIYSSCMEVLTMWDFQRERKKIQCKVPVEILYRGPLVKRLVAPLEELKLIFNRWNIEIDELNEKKIHSLKRMGSEESLFEKVNINRNMHAVESFEIQEPYFIQEIRNFANKECDILLFTPGGCTSSLKRLPINNLKNVWNTRFNDYVLSQGNITQISQEIKQKFPQNRPLYLLEAAIPRFTGINLDKIADNLRKAGKEVYYIPDSENKYR